MTYTTIALLVIAIALLLLFYDAVIRPAIPWKQKLKYPSVYGYLLLFFSFLSLAALNTVTLSPTTPSLQIIISEKGSALVDAISKTLWPILSFFIIIWLAPKVLFFLNNRNLEISPSGFKISSSNAAQSANTQPSLEDLTKNPAFNSLPPFQKRILEKLKTIQNTTDSHSIFFFAANIYAAFEFENIYNLIWGSQLAALRSLRETPRNNLNVYYENYTLKVKTLNLPYPVVTPEAWLNFLILRELIIKVNDSYNITDKGIEFLDYLLQKQYVDKTL